jgi:transcriptional regulator with XRE-family HTH domain
LAETNALTDEASTVRRNLGRLLASWRKTAGFTQDVLARHIGYSRSTIGNVETGGQAIARPFWEHADRALAAGGAILTAFEEFELRYCSHPAPGAHPGCARCATRHPERPRTWTGREIRCMRQAMRLSVREFAGTLGVSERMVSKWEAAGSAITPRPAKQDVLDRLFADLDAGALDLFGQLSRVTI